MQQRLEWIDMLKGFAILSVVIGHCVTDCMSSNNYMEYANLIKILYDSIYSFHMPLFFIISGFVFFLSKSYKRYKIKALDFTFIYIIWCFLLWLSKFFMAKDVNNPVLFIDLFKITYKPLMIYWYLYVLIFMYIVVSILKIHNVDVKLLVVSAIIALGSKIANFDIGIVNALLYYMYFFLMGGYILQARFIEKMTRIQLFILNVIILFNIYLYTVSNNLSPELILIKNFIVANVISLVCFYLARKVRVLDLLVIFGVYTLQIYVMHCFFTGGLRILFARLGIHNIYLYFIFGTILGLSMPIIVARLCKKHNVLNIIFEPINSMKRLGVIKE